MIKELRLHEIVIRFEDLVSKLVLGLKPHGMVKGVDHLVPDPVGGISCGMVKRPTSLAFDLSEVRLCAQSGHGQIQLLCQSEPAE